MFTAVFSSRIPSSILLERRKSAPGDFMAAAGMKGDAGAPVTPADLDALLAKLRERFSVRK